MPSFSIYRYNKPLVSGTGLFNIKLKNKNASFPPNIHAIIDIEELNSGLYALKRLSSALQSDCCIQASTLLNPNNKILPPNHNKQPAFNTAPHDAVETTAEQIIDEAVHKLIQGIPQQIQILQEALPELSLNTLPHFMASLLLLKIQAKRTYPFSEAQLNSIFSQMQVPADSVFLRRIKKELSKTIDQNNNEIRKQLLARSATQEEILSTLQTYEDQFVTNYFLTQVKPHLRAYATAVNQPVLVMLQQLHTLSKAQLPTPTPDNVETVNGKTVLQAMVSGVRVLLTKAPELASNSAITNILSLSYLLTQASLSADDLKRIYAASDTPSTDILVEFVDKRDAAIYKEGITKAFQDSVNNLTNVRLTISNDKKQLEEDIAAFQQVQLCFENLVKGAERLYNTNNISNLQYVKTEEYLQMYSSLTSLSQAYNTSSPAVQAILSKYVPQVQNLQPFSSSSSSVKLNDILAEVSAYIEISRVCLRSTIVAQATVVPFIQAKGTELKQYEFLKTIGVILNSYNASQVTALTTFNNSGYLIPNGTPFFNQHPTLSQAPDASFVSSATDLLQKFQTETNTYKLSLQAQVAQLEQQYEALDPSSAAFTNDRVLAVKDWLQSESLGSALIFLIQYSQLPKQRTFLEPLIKEVNFNNLAANAINDLLQITNAFSTSSVYYNLSSFLIESKEGKDLFNGDFFETSLALAKERECISRDQARCQQASAVVRNLLARIQALQDIPSAQKQQMLNATRMYEQVLSITSDQLIVLDSLLVNLKITPEKDSSGKYRPDVFKITGPTNWIPLLADLEGFLSNGYPDVSPSGGLGPLFTLIQSDQQNYTTQGQTQQLNLQNQMTNVQQEWTLVSTSMQVLNKMLSHLAGEIK